MLGQPRPVRRTSSRMRRAPPPYMGARATSAMSNLMGRSPRRYSATRGAVKMSAMAAGMLLWERVMGIGCGVGAVYIRTRGFLPRMPEVVGCWDEKTGGCDCGVGIVEYDRLAAECGFGCGNASRGDSAGWVRFGAEPGALSRGECSDADERFWPTGSLS